MPYIGSSRRIVPSSQVSTLLDGTFSLAGLLGTATKSATYIHVGTRGGESFLDCINKLNHLTNVFSWLNSQAVDRGSNGFGFSNSGTKGYGVIGLFKQSIDNRIYAYKSMVTYATDVMSTSTSDLVTSNTVNASGTQNVGTAGYHFGGRVAGTFTKYSGKMPFSTEVFATLGNTFLSDERHSPAAVANGSTAAYVLGGAHIAGGGAPTTDFDKVAFSTDTRSTSGSVFSGSTVFSAPFMNPSTAGYMSGGAGAGYTGTTRKVLFSTDTVSTVGALAVARGDVSGGNSKVAGYVFGGFGGSFSNAIEQMNFSVETWTTLSVTSFEKFTNGAGFSNYAA